MLEFKESKFYKLLQDFFINNDKETFIQMLAEFYNKTEGIIDKNIIQDEIIKELREMYIKFNEEGIDENIVREKVNYFIENSNKIQDIITKIIKNTNNIKNINSELEHIANNILNYGGNYNGVNSNDNAFNLAKGKGSVFFPQNETKNAVYYFENTPNMDNVVIESQENVILSFPTTNYITFKKAKIQNTIKIISRDRDNVGELITNSYSNAVYNSINQDIFGVKKLKQYNLDNLKGTRRYANNKEMIDITQHIIKDNRTLNWDNSSLDYANEFINLYEITDFEIGNMYLFCTDVGLLTDDDIFYITIADENKTFSAFQSNRKEIYYKGDISSGTWDGKAIGSVISPAYRLADGGSCIWSIRVISVNTVEIYINNVFITTLTLNNFTSIGFGFNSIASTIKTNFIKNILFSKIDKASYGKNLKIGIFGDSISYGEGANIGWPEHLENMLVGYRGIAKVNIDNFAVSGETSGQQLARLQGKDVSGYDFICVMVGTNDLGQQVDLVTFKNNISNIIDIIINDGSIPIIGVFPMTTSRDLTGYGVNNANYFNGGKYRSIIMEVCSEKDVIIADVMGELGQIGADNTQLRDNVHINTAFNVLISKSFSNSIKYKISSDF